MIAIKTVLGPITSKHAYLVDKVFEAFACEIAVYRDPAEGQYRTIRKPLATEAVAPASVPEISLRLAEIVG